MYMTSSISMNYMYYCYHNFQLSMLRLVRQSWLASWLELNFHLACMLLYFTMSDFRDMRHFFLTPKFNPTGRPFGRFPIPRILVFRVSACFRVLNCSASRLPDPSPLRVQWLRVTSLRSPWSSFAGRMTHISPWCKANELFRYLDYSQLQLSSLCDQDLIFRWYWESVSTSVHRDSLTS